MKKRFICLLLTLVMLVSLIPTTVITASAATGVSEAGVRLIKQTVGFKRAAYEVSKDVWMIGYGTPSVKGAVIEEKNADKLLRDKLASLSATVPGSLLQRQHDALVWLLYTEGKNSWGEIGSLAQAVVASNKTGSELVNGLTAFAGDAYDPMTTPAVLNRRMAIANLYLTGDYSGNVGSLGYTLFDANGGKFDYDVSLRFQAFDSKDVTKIVITVPTVPMVNGKYLTFMGWYDGSALITGLGTSTNRRTLKAMWQDSDKIKVNYSLPAVTVFETTNTPVDGIVPIMNEPNGTVKINNLNRDEIIYVVSEMITADGWKWLELSTGGWVKFYKSVDDVPGIVTNETVTVLDDYVNIRADKDFKAEKVGVAKKGEKLTILKIVPDASGNKWGYCSKGWVYLAGTDYLGSFASADGSVNAGAAQSGVISGAEKVNVRNAAGVYNNIVTTLREGTAVTVYEQVEVNGAPWGRIGEGRWVAMMYVTVNKSTQGGNVTVSPNRGSSAVVSSKVNLAVRTGPGTGYTKITSLVPGTSVVILHTQNVGGVAWGQIDQGWINLNYVTMIGSSAGAESAYGVSGTVVNCATGVNIRSAAGPTNALVGVARLGSKVNVSEIVEVNGFKWGHIANGWVCMDYVQLDGAFNPPEGNVDADIVVNDLMTVFDGYPAKTNTATSVLQEASAHAKELMTLSSGADLKIRGFKVTTANMYGKVAVGEITGWVNMKDVKFDDVNVKVTAASSNTYEEPSTRSKFYAALPNGTQLTIALSSTSNWTIADGIFWGKVTVKDSAGNVHDAWINMADVTMFRENEARTGITTLSGVGYMTGYVKADTVVLLDSNGNVTTTPSSYTLSSGQRVNILARNVLITSGATYGKVSVGSVVGWIDMGNVVLDPVEMKATAVNNRYLVGATDADIIAQNTTMSIPAGTVFTITDRRLVRSNNEMNNGLIDVGTIYIGEYTTDTALVVLDEGKMTPVSAATLPDNANPFVSASVIVSGKTTNSVVIREEASVNSQSLLTLSKDTPITILNWNLVGGNVWGKVQVNKIVGWVMVDSTISFAGLTGTVKNGSLSLYNNADKASSVQILRVNEAVIPVNQVMFDGRTVWGNVTIGTKNGWADLLELNLGTPTADYKPTNVIATGKVNSMKTDVSATDGSVISLPKGTEVKLTNVSVASGVATWTVTFGDKSGNLNMDYIDMNSAVATVTDSSIPVYGDFQGTAEVGRLYRGETTTINKFKAKNDVLCGEIVFNNESSWIVLAKGTTLLVSLVPGATNNNAGNNGGSTNPTENTTPSVEPTAAYIVCSSYVNIRSGAGVEYPQVTQLPNGKVVKIYEKTISAQGVEWARIDEGWVCMDYVRLGTATGGNTGNGGTTGAPSSPIIVTTVPAGAIAVGYATKDLEVYAGAGFGYGKSGTIVKNTSMVIYENALSGGVSWARTDAGWIILSYVVVTGIGQNGGTMGTIGRCGFTANVRSSANGLELTKVMINSRVAILETSGNWVRTALGWVSLDYVILDTESTPLPQNPVTPTNPGAFVETAPTEGFLVEVG